MYTLSNLPKKRRKPAVGMQESPPYTDDEIISKALSILSERIQVTDSLTSPTATRQFLRLAIGAEEREVFGVVLLDNQHRVLDAVPLFFGTIDGASVYAREVVKLSLDKGAAAVIFYHNHPSGVCQPSEADKIITSRLKQALGLIDVRVLDHLIVTACDSYSFADHGLI